MSHSVIIDPGGSCYPKQRNLNISVSYSPVTVKWSVTGGLVAVMRVLHCTALVKKALSLKAPPREALMSVAGGAGCLDFIARPNATMTLLQISGRKWMDGLEKNAISSSWLYIYTNTII